MASSDKNALAALARVTAATTDKAVLADARRMQRRLTATPMIEIINLVPGESLTAKAQLIGVTRTSLYSWLNGLTRPRRDSIVTKLSKVTGLDASVIRGRDDWSGAPR